MNYKQELHLYLEIYLLLKKLLRF